MTHPLHPVDSTIWVVYASADHMGHLQDQHQQPVQAANPQMQYWAAPSDSYALNYVSTAPFEVEGFGTSVARMSGLVHITGFFFFADRVEVIDRADIERRSGLRDTVRAGRIILQDGDSLVRILGTDLLVPLRRDLDTVFQPY